MHKKILTVFLCFFAFILPTKAQTLYGYVNDTSVKIRSGAGKTYEEVGKLNTGNEVTIIGESHTTDGSIATGEFDCTTNKWYQINYNGNTNAYICTRYVTLKTENGTTLTTTLSDSEFINYLKEQGFPSTYHHKLLELYKKHPNWIFKGIDTASNKNVTTPVTWQKALTDETKGTRSLVQITNSINDWGYASTSSLGYDYYTNTFYPKDGSTWYIANEQIVAYYLDPRNFLDERHIFMFENLNYNPDYQTREAVRKILYTNFWNNYIDYYIEAAAKYNVSPLHIASRSRQEVGINGSTMTAGNIKGYEGYYNFYGIGATAGANPSLNGLEYAKRDNGLYNLPWTSPYKAIIGGAEWIATGYIAEGQYTTYFQKWDFSPTSTYTNYHQYMQNIEAPASEAVATYNSYVEQGIIDEKIVFSIPYYTNMPEATSMPPKGNPNNFLSSLKVNGTVISGFDGAKENYEITVADSINKIDISANPVAGTSTVSKTGTIELKDKETTFTITVTAQNGDKKNYHLNIKKSSKEKIPIDQILNTNNIKNDGESILDVALNTSSDTLINKIKKDIPTLTVTITDSNNNPKTGTLKTGDIVSLIRGEEVKKYSIVINGDVNGDGQITIMDLLKVQKQILGSIQLSSSYRKAADINKDGNISLIDLLRIQKHILGTSKIE